jgi:hypothetical protein
MLATEIYSRPVREAPYSPHHPPMSRACSHRSSTGTLDRRCCCSYHVLAGQRAEDHRLLVVVDHEHAGHHAQYCHYRCLQRSGFETVRWVQGEWCC